MASVSFNIFGALIFILAGFLHPGLSRLGYFQGVEKAGVCMAASIFTSYAIN
jgi:hypothetical protein